MADPEATAAGRSRLPTRTAATARAETLVRDNRFTIAVVFPAVGALMLVASAESFVPDWLAFQPLALLFGVAVMRSPLLVALAPLVDRRAGVILVGLCGFTYGVEAIGLATGWPYGHFEYLATLGPTVGDLPLALPLLFLPLVANGVLLATLLLDGRATGRLHRIALAVALVLAIDLVLDPAAVTLGFWRYAEPGVYYGVPASNYAGWLLSATVAVVGIDAAFDATALQERLAACEFALDDLVSFTLLWGLVNLVYANWVPAAIALALLAALAATPRFDVPALGDCSLRS